MALVTSSVALVTSSVALVSSSFMFGYVLVHVNVMNTSMELIQFSPYCDRTWTCAWARGVGFSFTKSKKERLQQ